MIVLTAVFLFIIGACMGSFAVAQVWRFRADQYKNAHQPSNHHPNSRNCHPNSSNHHPNFRNRHPELVSGSPDYHEQQMLKQVRHDRSHCLHCGYQLRWFDLLPIVSWLALKGKCRHCQAKIGWLEITTELVLGWVFALSFLFWPYSFSPWGIAMFAIWLIGIVTMTILFIYDLKWSLLPGICLTLLAICATLFVICSCLQGSFAFAQIWSLIGALAVLPGIYFLLYLVSHSTWVGSGDYMLAFSVALFLADWRLALFALFAANLLGSIVGMWGMARGRLGRKSRIPFGPMLIVALVVIFLTQHLLLLLFNI